MLGTVKIILLIVIPLVLIYILVKAALQRRAMYIMNKMGKENIRLITSTANFFGQESAGLTQIRGNGILVLTEDKLYFELLLPKKTIEIPIEKIERIEETRSHLGKTIGNKLVKVIYRNESNSVDSCAWFVRDRGKWVNQLKPQ